MFREFDFNRSSAVTKVLISLDLYCSRRPVHVCVLRDLLEIDGNTQASVSG